MECEENGQCYVEPAVAAVWRRGVKRKLGGGGVGAVRLRVAAAVAGVPRARAQPRHRPAPHPPASHLACKDPHPPFMNNMDEITYWIHTKRAPCLMNYDNLTKKQNEKVKCSKPKSIHSVSKEPSPKRRKKKKLSILDGDDSASLDRQNNIYFEATQQKERTVMSSGKSDTLVSDIDFNIKKSSIEIKPKRLKLQKNNRSTVHKKNKVITSTPKGNTALRRSLRKAQNSLNNNSQYNVSFEVYNSSVIHGDNIKCDTHETEKHKKPADKLLNGNRQVDKKNKTGVADDHKNDAVHNGQFEDFSDVSGFTANYIRSTKIHSTKTPRTQRSKGVRNLMKQSQQKSKQDGGTLLVCANKSMNTAQPAAAAVLNCSTDSSQNVLHLISVQSTDQSNRVDRGTSLLKFIDAKTKNKESDLINNIERTSRQPSKTNLDNLFKSRDVSISRYPRRKKNGSREDVTLNDTKHQPSQDSADKRRKAKNSLLNNSDRKENPNESTISRTRSGRCIGLKLQQAENSVLVLNNSTELESSMLTINVAAPADQHSDNVKKKKRSPRVKYVGRAKRSKDKSGQSLQRDSLRGQSGFAACFSDSDDSEPLKQRKYFC